MGPGAPPARVVVEASEVTQAIQSVTHEVPLIAGKTTVVRLYLGVESATAVQIRGELNCAPAGAAASTVFSSNTVIVDPASNGQVQIKRDNLGLSLNFLLPVAVTAAGQATFRLSAATDVALGTPVDLSGLNRSVTVDFVPTPPLRVRVLGMRYSTGGQAFAPSPLDFSLVQSWLKRAYPVADVVMTKAMIDANDPWPLNADQINAQLAAIRRLDMDSGGDPRTHYFGIVADGNGANFMRGKSAGIPAVPDPTTVACGPTGPGTFGWDFDGSYGDWYTGHELGHTFGRRHPGFCAGNSADDPAFPYPNGKISPSDGKFVGWDSGDATLGILPAALPGTNWHDVMTYCDRQWLSAYTYAGIRERIVAEGAMGPDDANLGPPPPGADPNAPAEVRNARGDFINVIGFVNLTLRQGKISFVHPLAQTQILAGAIQSNVALQIRGADGSVLEKTPVELKLSSCPQPGEDRSGLVDAVLPMRPQAKFIDLMLDDVVLDTFAVAPAVPQLGAMRRSPRGAGPVAIAWDAAPAVAANVTYSIQLSRDEGATWQTIAVGRKSPEVQLDRDQFGDAGRLKVRVIATDGLTARTVTQTDVAADE